MLELMCAIEKMEDLVRRYSSRRDAQGNAHNLAEDIRMSPLEALLLDDLEKHVQLNRSRLTSYGVLREEIKTTVTVGATQMHETRNRKVHHTQEETTRWTLVHLAKATANKAKASTARAKAKASKDKSKDSVECWNCGKRGHYSKDCWSKRNTKGGSKGKHKTKNATDAHNLDSTKPANAEPEVEIDEFDMTYHNVDALQESEKMRGSEWIKIGVDTGAGKTAWPQSITYGTTIPGDSDLTFRTATGELVKGGKRVQVTGCDDWESNLRVRGVQSPVYKPFMSFGEYTTMGGVTVLYGDKGYMFH